MHISRFLGALSAVLAASVLMPSAAMAAPSTAAAPSAAVAPVPSQFKQLTAQCDRVAVLQITLDGATAPKYFNPANGKLSDTPSVQALDCDPGTVAPQGSKVSIESTSSSSSGITTMADSPRSYGAAYLTVEHPNRIYEDSLGKWTIQANHFASNYPVQNDFQIKPNAYTAVYSNVSLFHSTRVENSRTCSFNKSPAQGVPPTYLQHSVCAGHVKNKTYQTNGTNSWRFIIPNASGTATLLWYGRYQIL